MRLRSALAGVSLAGAALGTASGAYALSVEQPQLSSPLVFDWRETVRLEHEDRKARFQRLAEEGLIQTPIFYEALISGKDLPQFGADIPVLRIVFPQRVYFDTDLAIIRPEAERVLDVIAENLRNDVPDVALFIAGHADARGTDEHNYLLSVDRATSVAQALAQRGIGSTRIWRIGFGEAVPLVPNDSEEHMALNRRVEFLLAARAEAVAVWLATACSGSDLAVRTTCREKIALLPPVVADPVITERQVEVRTFEPRDDARIEEDREEAVTSGQVDVIYDNETKEHAKTAGEVPMAVEIEREDRVIIDLKEERVEVGVPYL